MSNRHSQILHSTLLTVFVCTAACSQSAQASPGDADTSFGSGGTLMLNNGSTDEGRTIIQQHDGKLVVIGYSNGDNWNDGVALFRLQADGSPDSSFGIDGRVMTTAGSSGQYGANAGLQLPDHKLVIAGHSYDSASGYDPLLLRYQENGMLDSSFGDQGVVITPMASTSDSIDTLIRQADGKLVAAGCSQNMQLFVLRYLGDGTPDTTFSGDGIATLPVQASWSCSPVSVVQQTNGKLVIGGGFSGVSGRNGFSLLRLNEDGSVDTSFGSNGMVTATLDAACTTLVMLPDGSLQAAGWINTGDHPSTAIAHFDANGSPDIAYGVNGTRTTDLGVASFLYTLAVQANGKFVAAGSAGGGEGNSQPIILRYNLDGTLDNTFADNGVRWRIDIGGWIESIIQQTDGKLVAAGVTFNGFNTDFLVLRMDGDALDSDDDGLPDDVDSDDDNDTVPDSSDTFPLDPSESVDTDGDGVGNNADNDDDNDGLPDTIDGNPLDPLAGMRLDGGYRGASLHEQTRSTVLQ